MGDSAAVVHLKNLTVQILNRTRNIRATGFIIGSISNPMPVTVIMTSARVAPNETDDVEASFYRHENISHSSTKVFYLLQSDIMVIAVNHQHSGPVLRFANVVEQPLVVYQGPTPIMTPPVRIHCVCHNESFNWLYHSGYIATELLTNSISPGYNIVDALDNDVLMFGHHTNTSSSTCNGGALVNDRLEILGMQVAAHGNSWNLLRSDPMPENPGQARELYEAQLDANVEIVRVHNLPFFYIKDAYIPYSSLTFAISIRYLDRKIRERIGDRSNLPLNEVVVNHALRVLRLL